jgi:hypothetical protein
VAGLTITAGVGPAQGALMLRCRMARKPDSLKSLKESADKVHAANENLRRSADGLPVEPIIPEFEADNSNDKFGLFSQDDKGPIWRGAFADFESAKFRAQSFANEEGLEFFVFSLELAQVVARFFPNRQAKPERS